MLRTYGRMPCWGIVFSTFLRCMSFHTAWAYSGHSPSTKDLTCNDPATAPTTLDSCARWREHFNVLVPRVIRGRKREHGSCRFVLCEFAEVRGCPRNCKRRARVRMATGKPGRPGATGQRPASQETCQRGHPTGGRGVHTERSFAAVTTMPVRSRERSSPTTLRT
jgi:hypothetical protein